MAHIVRCRAQALRRLSTQQSALPQAVGRVPAVALRGVSTITPAIPAKRQRQPRPMCNTFPQQVRSFSAVIEQAVEDFGGESITEGTLIEWKKKVGDAVAKDEVIAEIETDKVTIELKAKEAGSIAELLVKADDTVAKGQVLVKIAAGAPGAAASAPAAAAPAPAPAAAAGGPPGKIIEQSIKDLGGESITEGTLMEFTKKVGDFVNKDEVFATIETDKVTIEVKAEESGTIKELLVKADDTVAVGTVLAKIETGGAPSAGASAAAPAPAAAAPAAPAAAHEPELKGIRFGFAKAHALRKGLPWPPVSAGAPVASTAAAAASGPPVIDLGEGRSERRVPMSSVRKRVVKRMKDTQNTAALLSTFQEVDMSGILGVRAKYKDLFMKKNGAPLGLLSVFVKASALSLMEEPGVNAWIDDATQETVWRDYVDMAVPIPSPRGPVSCVLRNVESQSIRDIEHTIAKLTEKAGRDELTAEDMAYATFGITDSGVAGSMLGTSIINPPQSAIMGTNAITSRPTAVNGKVEARPTMYLSLTYDHRIIDGREAVTFLCSVRDKMEDPARMILGL